jgi:formylmethanofuran dehydrogenase subunit B
VSSIIENIKCKFCGCLCDDITAEIENGRITKAKNACPNGRSMFLSYDPSRARPLFVGIETDWDTAIKRSAEIINKADSPLIYGLSSTSTEAQKRAVELADLTGAIIDSTSSVCHFPTSMAVQMTGEPTCTLGEVKNRADLIIFWGCNPLASHIRHFARYSINSKGMLTPEGRKNRRVIVVDVRPTDTSKIADTFIQIKPGTDFEVLTALRAIISGHSTFLSNTGGIPADKLAEISGLMKSCRYGVIFFGMGITMTSGRKHNVSELFTLVRELNQYTRFSAMPMRGHGNVAGIDQVLTWYSGYPAAVSFARGVPQFGPGEFTSVDMLASKEADAALIMASDPGAHFPETAAKYLAEIPTILMSPETNCSKNLARIFLPVSCCGIDTKGTAYRMDNIPIPLKAALERKRPSDEEILIKIIEEIKKCS